MDLTNRSTWTAAQLLIPLAADGEGALRWFIDGRYLGSSAIGERLWWTPEPGRHELLVMDGRGRRSRRTLTVR